MLGKSVYRIVSALLVLVFALTIALDGNAQQFTMKGGASIGSVTVPPRDAADKSGKMVNYYWEFNYGLRFKRYRFVTAGLAYLGSGCTFHYNYQPTGYVAPYNVRSRFSNVLVPIKFKVSTEHRSQARYYFFAGTAPGWMFQESREMSLDKLMVPDGHGNFKEASEKQMEAYYKRNNIPAWTPKRFQNYLLSGVGAYYKHVVLDFSVYVSLFKDYKEFLAPVSLNYGFLLCVGYQVSRDSKKMW